MINLRVIDTKLDPAGNILGYVLQDGNGTSGYYAKEQMKNKIKTGEWSVEGFIIDQGGRLQDRRHNQRPQQQSNRQQVNKADIGRILDELKSVKRLLAAIDTNDVSTQLTTLGQQVTTLQPIDYTNFLVQLDSKIDSFITEYRHDMIESKNGSTAILNKLNELGVHNDEEFKALEDKFSYLFNGRTMDGTIKYPRCKKDLNYDLIYNKKDISLNEQEFNDAIVDSQTYNDYDSAYDKPLKNSSLNTIFTLSYDEQVISVLRKHIEVVNNVRASVEESYADDLNNNHFKGIRDREAEEISTVKSAYVLMLTTLVGGATLPTAALGTIALSSVANIASKAVKPVKDFGSMIYRGIPALVTNDRKVKDFRGNGVGAFETRNYGVYNLMTFTDINDSALKDAHAENMYTVDIRLFVVNCMGCLVKKDWKDNVTRKGAHYFEALRGAEKKPYSAYVKHSLAILPIKDDERLFNFYCQFYLSKYTRIDNMNLYAQSKTGLDSYKAQIDMFINAYFAAKKSMLSVASDFFPLLDKLTYQLSTNDEIIMYGQFLWRVKMCLVIQGMAMKRADWMLRKFMISDGTYSIYENKNIQFRSSSMTNGYEVR